ncbi:hypothetical protein B5P46_24700 [Rhizobium leguminosarum]|uniref:Uncharacterized protein n=1 Tax=Rhizobium leguminosarum TaxID=384 RepID=A0A4Q1TLV5_RHILE|nr:hypothetical protein [Rhizobium leguminosarum]RXT19526.1 hypothetical protein B5P46_24700 [Rhizobium leguminosarum]
MWQGLRRLHIQIAVSVPPLVVALTSPAFAADPFASNNGLYRDQSQRQGTYRSLNYDYPETADAAAGNDIYVQDHVDVH